MYNYNIGTTLKYIRKEKGMTQTEICTNVCSRTFLSKVENNESIPNTFVMANILNNLNVNFDEFFFLTQEFQKDKFRHKENICTSFFSLRDNHEDLDNIILDCQSFLERYSDAFISDILKVSQFLNKVKKQTDFNFEKSELESIWIRIQKMNILTLNEIRLVNCILFYFPSEISKNISIFILKQLEKYNNYTNNSNLIMSIYLNISTLYFYNKEFEESKNIIEKVITYAEKNNRFDILYLSKYRLSIIINDIELQNKCHNILKNLDLNSYIPELEKEILYYNKYK